MQILVDFHMPVLSGPATARAIRDICQREGLWFPPIVALCGATAPEELRECSEAGCVRHIAKPLSRRAFDELRLLAATGRATRADFTERKRQTSIEARAAMLGPEAAAFRLPQQGSKQQPWAQQAGSAAVADELDTTWSMSTSTATAFLIDASGGGGPPDKVAGAGGA